MSEETVSDADIKETRDARAGAAPTAAGTNQMVRQGFQGMELAGENAATQAMIAKSRADVESRFIMALRFPRNMHNVRQNLITECKRTGFAQTAIYALPRGDKMIRGLTIRAAEVAARCMGNMPIEITTIFDSDDQRMVRVMVTDLESNVTWSRDITIQKTVERKFLKRGQHAIRERSNSFGERVYIVEATDDDVMTKEAALVSKTARTLILRMMPGHLKAEMFEICDEIIAKKIDADPDAERRRMCDSFAEFGVTPTDIETFIGTDLAKMTAAEMTTMRYLYGGIRDGETTWKTALEERLSARDSGAPLPPVKPSAKQAAAAAAAPQKPADPLTTAAPANATQQQRPAAAKGTEGAKNKITEQKQKAAQQSTLPVAPAKTETAEQRLERISRETTAARAQQGSAMHDPNAQPPDDFGPKTNVEPAPDIKPTPAAAPLQLVPQGREDFVTVPCALCGEATSIAKGEDASKAQCDACANA